MVVVVGLSARRGAWAFGARVGAMLLDRVRAHVRLVRKGSLVSLGGGFANIVGRKLWEMMVRVVEKV